jgi:hypothetical protein
LIPTGKPQIEPYKNAGNAALEIPSIRLTLRDKSPYLSPKAVVDKKSEIIKNGNIAGMTENAESLIPETIAFLISLEAKKVKAIITNMLKTIIELCVLRLF